MRCALGLLLLFVQPVFARPDLQESILVRLKKDLSEFVVNGANLSFGEGEARVRKAGVGRWQVRWNPLKMQWVVHPVGQANDVTIFKGKNLPIQGSLLKSAFSSYPDRLVLRSKGSKFDLIGDVDFRTYLSGVVSHEMPTSWPLETLKAQTIAARSYALAVKNERKKLPWHVESTIDDQVFRHIEGPAVKNVAEAVKATDGQILTSEAGKVLKAFYHADCGGRTASAKTVWGTGPDMGTTVDATCPSNPSAQWSLRISTTDLMKKLKKNLGEKNLLAMALVPDRFDGRVGNVRLKTDGGDEVVKASEFRMLIGSQEIKSTRFDVTQTDGVFEFKGRGFGHGVGLCQWGSRSLGMKGEKAEAILSHYYPKAALSL